MFRINEIKFRTNKKVKGGISLRSFLKIIKPAENTLVESVKRLVIIEGLYLEGRMMSSKSIQLHPIIVSKVPNISKL